MALFKGPMLLHPTRAPSTNPLPACPLESSTRPGSAAVKDTAWHLLANLPLGLVGGGTMPHTKTVFDLVSQ